MPFNFFSSKDQHRQTCPGCTKNQKPLMEARIETSALTDLAYISTSKTPGTAGRLADIKKFYPIFQLYFPRLANLHENEPDYLKQPDAHSCKIFIIPTGNAISTQELLSFASAGSFHHYVCICMPGAVSKINLWHTKCLLEAMTETSSPRRQRLASLTSLFKSKTRTATASITAPNDLLFFFFNLPAPSVAKPDAEQPLTFESLRAHLPRAPEPPVRLRRSSTAGTTATAATAASSTAYTYQASQYSSDDDELPPSSPPVGRVATPPSDAALRQSLLFRENEYTEVVAGPQCHYCHAPVMHSFLQTPEKKVYGNVFSLDPQLASLPEFSEIIKRPLIRPRAGITDEILHNIMVHALSGPLPLAEFSNRMHASYPKFGNNDILVGIKPDQSLAWMHTRCFQTNHHHKESVLYSAIDVVASEMETLPPIPSAPMPRPPSPPAAAAASASDGIVYAELDFAPTGYVKIVRFLSNS